MESVHQRSLHKQIRKNDVSSLKSQRLLAERCHVTMRDITQLHPSQIAECTAPDCTLKPGTARLRKLMVIAKY